MSNLSEFVGGGKLCTQEFLASGTFTPSTRLLALGGKVLVELIGGGASGALIDNSSAAAAFPSGGDAGRKRVEVVTVTSTPVAVTIGAGGAAATTGAAANLDGNDGGDSSFGALVAKGGRRGYAFATLAQAARGGDGISGPGCSRFNSSDNAARDLRGGAGLEGRGGGGGGACPDVPENQVAVDGGGDGKSVNTGTLTANVTGNDATANTGAGGGALRLIVTTHAGFTASSGAGSFGWCRVTWFE